MRRCDLLSRLDIQNNYYLSKVVRTDILVEIFHSTPRKMWFITYSSFIFILVCKLSNCREMYTKINSKPDHVVFKYPEKANSERKLQECKKHEACNVVHERFWLPILVERICRCPNGYECPWSAESSDSSMMLNNRSLFKFCETPMNQTTCTHMERAAVVHGKIKKDRTKITAHNIRINCKCPKTHYWKLQKYTFEDDDRLFQIFRCRKQTMCDGLDFCGYVRADLYSVYYRCTCPEGHLCITKDREQENVQELLYTGRAYKAYCLPWE